MSNHIPPFPGPRSGTVAPPYRLKFTRRPDFLIHWVKAGRVDAASPPDNTLLQVTRGIYLVFTVRDGKTCVQYVGMTYRQNFAKRVAQHIEGISRFGLSVTEDRYVYAGWVKPVAYKKLSRRMLQDIESYFIWAMKPPGNASKRKVYRGREMIIQNTGDHFGLPAFLYVCPQGGCVLAGQGETLDDLLVKVVSH